jgi:HAMP domain-containing protein
MKIKRLADWADAISLGHMDTEPANIQSKDEIGELTDAIGRMQESIRISLERLNKRRN